MTRKTEIHLVVSDIGQKGKVPPGQKLQRGVFRRLEYLQLGIFVKGIFTIFYLTWSQIEFRKGPKTIKKNLESNHICIQYDKQQKTVVYIR